jgi:hypothetical protein
MGKLHASRIQLRMRRCTKPKSFCASMAVIWISLYTWMRYLSRLPFGSIKIECSGGVSLDSRPSESKCLIGRLWLAAGEWFRTIVSCCSRTRSAD